MPEAQTSRCYEVSHDGPLKISLAYSIDQEKEVPVPVPEDWWYAAHAMEYTHDGRFGPITRQRISEQWVRINPRLRELPDTMGLVYEDGKPPLIVSGALKSAIQALDADICDFVTVGKIWDRRFEREIVDFDYHFMAPLVQLDSWDREATDLAEIMRDDGTSWFAVNYPRAVRRDVVEGRWLWKDALTRTLLCSDAFRVIMQSVGCRGLKFYEIPVL